jgi:hypothetical protein
MIESEFRRTGIAVVDRILEGTAPESARAASARGALPVSRDILHAVLVALCSDPVPGIAQAASKSLEGFKNEELTQLLGDPAIQPFVLNYYARLPELATEPLSALVANPELTDDTLVRIANSRAPAAIDALLLNQQRLAKCPAAVDALTANPSLNADQRRRFLDFVEHIVAPAPARTQEPEGLLDPELLGPVSEEELRSLLGEMADLPFIDLEVGEFLTGTSVIAGQDEIEAMGENFESVFKQLLRMNPAQKLRAAFRVGREGRGILIRDTNRMVASAVLRNPRLTEEEVVNFAAQKGLSEDIMRQIGGSRAWMGSYSVVHNVVRNPKTPIAIAMNNLSRLVTKDLTRIVRDRNIQEIVRRSAKKHIEMRQPKRVAFKRGH